MNHPSEQYCLSLDGTHTEICRFAGLQDQNFIAVSGHLKRIVGEVRKYSRGTSYIGTLSQQHHGRQQRRCQAESAG